MVVLVIEDEGAIADNVCYALETEGLGTIRARTGHAAIELLRSHDVGLVILDIGLPDVDGFSLFHRLREERPVPVIFLTARGTEVDRVVGLELGADDYVVKPFSPRELSARVKAVLRRASRTARIQSPAPGPAQDGAPTDAATVAPGGSPVGNAVTGADELQGLMVNEDHRTFTWNGRRLSLTPCEYRLLMALRERPGRVFSRDELLERAWEDPGSATDRTIDAHVRSLRAKLKASGAPELLIRTHRGFGYSFCESGHADAGPA